MGQSQDQPFSIFHWLREKDFWVLLPFWATASTLIMYGYRAYTVSRFNLIVASELVRRQGVAGYLAVVPTAADIAIVGLGMAFMFFVVAVPAVKTLPSPKTRAFAGRGINAMTIVVGTYLLIRLMLIVFSSTPWMPREVLKINTGEATIYCDGYVVGSDADKFLIVLGEKSRDLWAFDVDNVQGRYVVAQVKDSDVGFTYRMLIPPYLRRKSEPLPIATSPPESCKAADVFGTTM